MRACYIAGPMRGRADFNFPAFFRAEHELVSAGWRPFNPARMDVIADGWPSIEALEGTRPVHRIGLSTEVAESHADIGPTMCRKYAERDTKILIQYLTRENDDALVLLPGWEKSTGANAEYHVAKWVMLHILTLDEAIGGTT